MQDDLDQAMRRLSLNMCAGVMESRPYTWLMYDGGAFRSVVGRGAKNLMINIRKLSRPYPVDTASGIMNDARM